MPIPYRLLRISVTDRCNFRCCYCMPAEGIPKVARAQLLTLEHLSEVAVWLSAELGIERVKLTGGEPLVRRGIEALIARLAALPGIREVSLTTNGSLLAGRARQLKAAGLARVNVSLDSLDAARFQELTRGGSLAATLQGIDAAGSAGLLPIKLNAVLRRSAWEQDVPALLDFAAARRFEIRFIELMRTGTERAWCQGEYLAAPVVERWLAQEYPILAANGPASAPARLTRVLWRGHSIEVGWITPRSHPFCKDCDRLRLDARGRIHRCLMDPESLDVSALRRAPRADARLALHSYLNHKTAPESMDRAGAMSVIGG